MNQFTKFIEGDLEITLQISARKFDDENAHGLSHCMSAVDFIVEMDEKIIFIEFKDFTNPKAPRENIEKDIKKFQSGTIDHALKTKFRDSWFYEWQADRTNKPIYYYVLIAVDEVASASLLKRTEELKRLIPINDVQGKPWNKPFIQACMVFNLASWNKLLPHFSVKRLSACGESG